MRTAPTIVVALAAGLLVAGCSDGEAGTPTMSSEANTSAAPTSSASESSSPNNGAPEVENPLDTSYFAQHPCESLTDSEVDQLLGETKEHEGLDGPSGPDCGWQAAGSSAIILVIYPKLTGSSLSALYEKRDDFELFEPQAAVEGYPAVAYSSGDERDNGKCQVAIGTSNEKTIDISVTLGEKSKGNTDPCEAVHDVATKVIGNIKAGGK